MVGVEGTRQSGYLGEGVHGGQEMGGGVLRVDIGGDYDRVKTSASRSQIPLIGKHPPPPTPHPTKLRVVQ